jgi:hypothetical protein
MTPKQSATVTKITGKAFDELSESELANLSMEIQAQLKAKRDALINEQYSFLASTAKKMAEVLGWEKLQKIALNPDAEGKNYEVCMVTEVTKKTGKRTNSGINCGDITIKKLSDLKGGSVKFKFNGKEYTKIQELVKDLKQTDGRPESERCWDIVQPDGTKKGISSSDIVTHFHADEVSLVYQDGKEQSVKEAVEEAKKARESN